MPRSNSINVKLAREIIAGGRSLPAQGLFDLAEKLEDENQIGYARRMCVEALDVLPANARVDLRNKTNIKLALCTYKDADLPADERLNSAESILLGIMEQSATLTPAQHQKTLGILGGVNKQRWLFCRQKVNLEKALEYYRKGYELGIASDAGYTAVNTAFVLDLLGDANSNACDTAAACRQQSSLIREQIVVSLLEMANQDRSLEAQWWFDCTLGEAFLGLRRYDDARQYMQKAAVQTPANWRLESAARQIGQVVRLQAKEDGLPIERWREAPGFAVLHDLLAGSADAALSMVLGKVGLGLSGGGFRASLYHIGVLARLAELDMLRHVEVISCVSGGSILGAHYYLELRHLLQTKPDTEITREDYIAIVKNVERSFLQGVQRNMRMRMILEPGSNWKVLTSRNSTSTDRLADLYEREIYSHVRDEKYGARKRYIQDLLVVPAGLPPGERFDPRYDNWSRINKVPMLILNATSLNTCHNWQFTASFMGEPPVRGIDRKIDGNDRLRRIYYEDAPHSFRHIRLGQAVAASACVPGLFEPLVLDRLYQGDYVLKLVDGGVYDNQGASSLSRQDCTVFLVSDASGQTGIEKRPVGDRIGVSLRSNNVLMARTRQEQYQSLSVITEAGLLRGFAYVHLKKDLDAEPVDWIDCPDPSRKDKQTVLTSYGLRRDIQKRLAAVRTDLDSFSDAEADALALSGYLMMTEEFQKNINGFPISSSTDPDWRFLDIAPIATSVTPMPELDALKKVLNVAHGQALKALKLSTGLKVAAVFGVLAVMAGIGGFIYSLRGVVISVNGLLAVLSLMAIAAGVAKLLLRYVFHNPNPLWQVIAAVPLLFIGWPLLLFFTAVIDPIYLRAGPSYRKPSR